MQNADVIEAEFKEISVPIENDKVDLRKIIHACMVDIEAELPKDLEGLKKVPELHIEGKLLIKLFNRGYKIVPLPPTKKHITLPDFKLSHGKVA